MPRRAQVKVPRIRVIQAGGTLDKDYLPTEDSHGQNFVIGEAAFHAIWERAGKHYSVEFTCACQKDSKYMNDGDREEIRLAVLEAPEKMIIITHGTDTIQDTARYLADIKGKVIVLVGAFKPEPFRNTDADFNVGMAMGAVQCRRPGVYVVLYGEVESWKTFTHD